MCQTLRERAIHIGISELIARNLHLQTLNAFDHIVRQMFQHSAAKGSGDYHCWATHNEERRRCKSLSTWGLGTRKLMWNYGIFP